MRRSAGEIRQSLIGLATALVGMLALSLVCAKPPGGQEGSREGKKGADQGIDGVINFIDDNTSTRLGLLVQVKSGHVKRGDIEQLVGTVHREKAAMGLFVTLEEPTAPMTREALSSGYYTSPGWSQDYTKIQILTIQDLLRGEKVKMPPTQATFKQAQRVKTGEGQQTAFDIGS